MYDLCSGIIIKVIEWPQEGEKVNRVSEAITERGGKQIIKELVVMCSSGSYEDSLKSLHRLHSHSSGGSGGGGCTGHGGEFTLARPRHKESLVQPPLPPFSEPSLVRRPSERLLVPR